MSAKRLLVAAAFAGVVASAGCTKVSNGGGGSATHSWTQPGVFRFSEGSDPKNLNVVLDAATPTLDLSMFIFSWAIRYNDKAQPVPDALREIPTIANGDVSKDGLTLKYKLRPNIKWQDGAPLTCNDLKFTWQVVMNPHNNVVTTDGYKSIGSIDCSDPLVADHPHEEALRTVSCSSCGASTATRRSSRSTCSPSTTTPKARSTPRRSTRCRSAAAHSRSVAWNRGQDVRMVANPYFYLGKPKLNEVIYKILPDENTEQTQLETHEIDMLAAGSAMKWPQYVELASNPANGVVAVRVNSFLFSHIDFNLRHPIVNDRNVRVALAYATNRQEIIGKLLHGSAIASETDQSPKLSWAYTKDITHYPYDPEKARATLDADGWKVGPDGVRVKNGQRLEFSLSTQTESNYGKALQTLLQREWREVGVQADIKNYPTSEFFENSANGILQGGHYDVAGFSWYAAADPDDSAIYSAENLAPHGQNAMFWTNATATAAMNDALSTVDQRRRRRDYAIVQQQLSQDVPTIIVSFSRLPFVYNTDLKGFQPSPVISAFWNPWNYSI